MPHTPITRKKQISCTPEVVVVVAVASLLSELYCILVDWMQIRKTTISVKCKSRVGGRGGMPWTFPLLLPSHPQKLQIEHPSVADIQHLTFQHISWSLLSGRFGFYDPLHQPSSTHGLCLLFFVVSD